MQSWQTARHVSAARVPSQGLEFPLSGGMPPTARAKTATGGSQKLICAPSLNNRAPRIFDGRAQSTTTAVFRPPTCPLNHLAGRTSRFSTTASPRWRPTVPPGRHRVNNDSACRAGHGVQIQKIGSREHRVHFPAGCGGLTRWESGLGCTTISFHVAFTWQDVLR